MTKLAFGMVVSPSPAPTYAGGSGTWTMVSKEYCAALDEDSSQVGGVGIESACSLAVTNGSWSNITCSTGTLSGTLTVGIDSSYSHSVTFDFTVTLASGGGALFGPGGPNVPNANDSAGVQPGPNALVYGSAALDTLPRVPDEGLAGPCTPNATVGNGQWSLDAQLVIEADPYASENTPGDPVDPAGFAPDTALDPDVAPDTDLLSAQVAVVGIDGDTGVFVQPPMSDPGGGSGRTCSRGARHTGAASATTAVHAVYFVPSDVKAQWYDLPILCNDGYHEESTIGYAMMNARNWMASPTAGSAGPGLLKGKSYKRLKRTDSAYSRSFSHTDVRFFRSSHPDSYFHSDTYKRITDELTNAGWGNSRYMVFADVENWQGYGGTGRYRGKYATGFRRNAHVDASGNLVHTAVKWGCASEADTAAEHEMTHTFGAVPPSSSQEYDTKHPGHATGPGDIMYWQLVGTFSGKHTNGSAAPNTYWDVATDTYSSAVLGFGSYLESNGNVALHVC